MSHDDPHGHADPHAPPPASQPEPAPAPEPERTADGTLRPIQDSDYFSMDPEVTGNVSRHIDNYFNKRLDIFPYWETEGKPDRFHVLFAGQIAERFQAPQDIDLRDHIHDYGRRVFGRLLVHVGSKRFFQAGALTALAALALIGPTWFAGLVGSQPLGLAMAVGAMVVVFGLWWAVQAILFVQYRYRLENDTYELSREIVGHTRELQNQFTHARAAADQAETHYQMDGKGWGQRALYLTRLTMWLAARMEYLEKYVQMELWRVRRERYWMRWVGRFLTPAVFLGFLAFLALEPVPAGGEAAFRGLQAVAALLGAGLSWVSYFRWQTPTTGIRDKLGVDGWVRYASLDVDNSVADQVRRDKERLVEYRALTRGR